MAKEEFMGTDGVRNSQSIYDFDEMTRYGFMSHMESFIKDLMENPLNAVPDEYLKQHGIDRITALNLLTQRTVPNDPNSAVLIRITKIKPETMEIEDLKGKKITKTGKDLYSVKYRMPKKDVNKKLRNLYIENFEENRLNEAWWDDKVDPRHRQIQIVKKEEDDKALKISIYFGKNGRGLSSEFLLIGDFIDRLSNDYSIFLDKSTYIDSLDDVYKFDFVLRNQNQEKGTVTFKELKKYFPHSDIFDAKFIEEPIDEGIIGIDNGEYGHYIKEDGEGGVMGGATTSVSSGQYVQPMGGKPIRRALYITQEQNDYLKDKLNEESPAEVNTMFGDFGFDANGLKTKKSDSAFNHKEIFKKGGFNNVENR